MTTINGLLGHINCVDEQGHQRFELALGEDGKVYPLSEGLVDLADAYEAGISLGLDKLDMIEGDECMLRYLEMEANPNRVICQSNSLYPFLMGRIVWQWMQHRPFCYDPWKFTSTPEACRVIQEAQHFVHEYFAGEPVYQKNVFQKAKKAATTLQNEKTFIKSIGKGGLYWLQAFEQLADIGVAIEEEHGKHIGHKALKASFLMEKSFAARSPYRGYGVHANRAARQSQVIIALKFIEDFEAWDVEINVD